MTASTTAPRWCYQNIFLFTKKNWQNQLSMKKYVFAFYHFNNFFGTDGHIPAIFNFLDLILSSLSHSQSPQNSKTYLESLETKICKFWVLKAVWRKNYDYKPQFFFEILKAVCPSVDWVPKLIHKILPTMDQKLVQQCETEIVADVCNAS